MNLNGMSWSMDFNTTLKFVLIHLYKISNVSNLYLLSIYKLVLTIINSYNHGYQSSNSSDEVQFSDHTTFL